MFPCYHMKEHPLTPLPPSTPPLQPRPRLSSQFCHLVRRSQHVMFSLCNPSESNTFFPYSSWAKRLQWYNWLSWVAAWKYFMSFLIAFYFSYTALTFSTIFFLRFNWFFFLLEYSYPSPLPSGRLLVKISCSVKIHSSISDIVACLINLIICEENNARTDMK